MRFSSFAIAAVVAATTVSPLSAAPINVLWTSGTDAYNANIRQLATQAATFDPDGDGALDWNLTLWDGGAVDFAAYDVLVVGSTYAVDRDHAGTGYFGLGVSARGVLDNGAAIAAARGDRTFLSGQDADWHNIFNLPNRDNGPKGFMINAVNWAASGAGLGIVSMTDRFSGGTNPNTGWWNHPDSFLAAELGGTPRAVNTNIVSIGPGQESFPINEGLTTGGLSNWNTSSHACFGEVSGYVQINFFGTDTSGCGVTIVTAGEEDGGTGGPSPIPLPAAGWMLIAAIGGLGAMRRRR